MPLLKPKFENYFLHSDVIYVDTGLDKDDPNQTNSDFTVKLKKEISNVVGFELIRYDLPENAFSPLSGTTAVDFTIENTGGLAARTLTAWLGSAERPLYLSDPPTNLEISRINQAFSYALLQDDIYGDYGNIIVSANSQGRLVFQSQPSNSATNEITLLFGSGANVSQSAASVLGFTAGTDVSSSLVGDIQVINAPVKPRVGETMYLDITIDEARELDPLRRIYLGGNRLIFNETSDKTRLLTDPIHRLKVLTFKLRIKKTGDVETEVPFDGPMFFEIKVTYTHPTIETPIYVKDRPMAV